MALLRVLPVLVTALFCVTCGVTFDGPKIGHMIGRIVGLVLTDRDPMAAALLLAFSMTPRLGVGGAIGVR